MNPGQEAQRDLLINIEARRKFKTFRGDLENLESKDLWSLGYRRGWIDGYEAQVQEEVRRLRID